jgi:hypothetical protein
VVKTAPTDYRWPSSTEVLPVSFASRRPGAAPLRRLVVVGLTAAVLASGTIVPASASAVRTPAVAPAAPAAEEALPEGLLPTIHYEDAVAHAGDRI